MTKRDKEPSPVSLENIRQRLEMMCAGSLAVTQADGGGTVVKVAIPDGARTLPRSR